MKVNNQFKVSLKSATRWLPAALLVAGLTLLCWPQLSNWYDASATNQTSTQSHAIEVSPSSRSQAVQPRDEATPVGKLPIESLRVGDRVLAVNPEVTPEERAAFVEPNWQEWLQLSLSMPKGDGSLLTIELLRPESWVRSQIGVIAKPKESAAVTALESIEEGSTDELSSQVSLSPIRPIYRELVEIGAELELSGEELQALFVDMDLPELAITGAAVIHDIHNAPLIVPGQGRVVTATFKHSSGDVIDLVLSDGVSSTAPTSPESIGTTSNHPFWSVDRGEYVQAGQLELGERVQTYSGDTKRVLAKLPRPGPEAVYNLEVFAEHVYYVGEDGVLVHNSGEIYGTVYLRRGENYVGSAKVDAKTRYGRDDFADDLITDIPAGEVKPHDVARGVEQVVMELGGGPLSRGNTSTPLTNAKNAIDPYNQAIYHEGLTKYEYRTKVAREFLKDKYGRQWKNRVRKLFGF